MTLSHSEFLSGRESNSNNISIKRYICSLNPSFNNNLLIAQAVGTEKRNNIEK